MFATKGYVTATVDDIVTAVAIARGTFYLYFDDKLDVFSALVDDFFRRTAQSIEPIDLAPGSPSPRAQLRENLRRVMRMARSNPAMVKIALSTAMGVDAGLDERLRIFYGALRQFMDETLETGQAIGLVREGADRRLMLAMAVGGLKELMLDIVSGELEREEDVLLDEMMAFLERGLLA